MDESDSRSPPPKKKKDHQENTLATASPIDTPVALPEPRSYISSAHEAILRGGGITKWTLLDISTAGNPPVSATQGEPRTPAKKANFEGKNIDFFQEFGIEATNAGLGEAVRERNRNWFQQVNSRWNVDWATGWGTAETLNESPGGLRT